MNEKTGQDMDGRVLKEIVRDEFLSNHPIHFESQELEAEVKASIYSEAEEKYIKDKLQGLGYIE